MRWPLLLYVANDHIVVVSIWANVVNVVLLVFVVMCRSVEWVEHYPVQPNNCHQHRQLSTGVQFTLRYISIPFVSLIFIQTSSFYFYSTSLSKV